MANTEEMTRKVLKALGECGMGAGFTEGCEVCPYHDHEGKTSCVSLMANDAYAVIIHLDGLVQQMTDPNTRMIDKTAKPVQGARYCKENRTCYGVGHECPYRNQKDCFESMVTDLLNLIEGGDD